MSVQLCEQCGLWPENAIEKLMKALMNGDNLTTAQLMVLQRDTHPEDYCLCNPSRTHPCAVNWCCSKPRWFHNLYKGSNKD